MPSEDALDFVDFVTASEDSPVADALSHQQCYVTIDITSEQHKSPQLLEGFSAMIRSVPKSIADLLPDASQPRASLPMAEGPDLMTKKDSEL
jgi:hypothetical protein